MKLNNKGFAISSIMYIILVLAIILIALTLAIFSSRKLILDKLRDEVLDSIYMLPYGKTLDLLKEEAIIYANKNNIEKQSIKIEDFETSIDKKTLTKHNLYNKYLTISSNDNTYDVYLGSIKTVTDISKPISNVLDIAGYKINGNSYQKTYTGKNLLNVPKTISNSSYVYSLTDEQKQSLYDLEVGTTYRYSGTFTHSEESYANTMNGYIFVKLEDGTDKWLSLNTSFTLNSKITSVIGIYGDDKGTWTLENPMIEKGSKATSYEPYVGGFPSPNPKYPQEIKSVGDLVTDGNNAGKYVIPVKIYGKQLVDKNNLIDGYIKSDGTVESVYWYNCTDFIEVSGDYLTYSNSQATLATLRYYAFYDKNKNFISGEPQKSDNEGSTSYTIKIPSGAKYFRYNIAPSYVDKAMVELGDTATDYEEYKEPKITNIYLNEPLRGINSQSPNVQGFYYDIMSSLDNQISRKIKHRRLSSNDGWGTYDYNSKYNVFKIVYEDSIKNYGHSISSHFNFKATSWSSGAYSNFSDHPNDNSKYFVMDKETLTEWKVWLDNNEVILEFALLKSDNESVELPHLNTPEGSIKIQVGSSVLPSGVEFTIIEKIKQL